MSDPKAAEVVDRERPVTAQPEDNVTRSDRAAFNRVSLVALEQLAIKPGSQQRFNERLAEVREPLAAFREDRQEGDHQVVSVAFVRDLRQEIANRLFKRDAPLDKKPEPAASDPERNRRRRLNSFGQRFDKRQTQFVRQQRNRVRPKELERI
jgi:hypothetical protein